MAIPFNRAGRRKASPSIVITADETMMSEYRGSMFLGFSTCSPRGILPDWLFFMSFAPPVPRKNGRAVYSDFGLRMVEASLLQSGFSEDEVAVVHPRDLGKVVGEETKIVAIGGHDLLGINPPTSTFVDMIRSGPPYNRIKFLELLKNKNLGDVKIMVGGKGAWQVADSRVMDRLGIDYVHLGEGEISIPKTFRKILQGEEVPRIVTGEDVPVEMIPNLRGATTHGLVEISRGCGRGCAFCTPGMQKVRHKPIGHILTDVRLNLAAGCDNALLHCEDVLRYGSRGIEADSGKVLELLKRVAALGGIGSIGFSHIALATAYHHPGLVREVSELLSSLPEQTYNGAQTGIETGSSKLMQRHMRGKCLPSSPDGWREIVTQSLGLLSDNNWALACTLIIGLPGEDEDDVIQTLELIDDIGDLRVFVVPMNFVSMGPSRLSSEESFTVSKMTPEHWTLFGKCLEHDVKLARKLGETLLGGNFLLKRIARYAMNRFIDGAEISAQTMKKGEPPNDYGSECKYLIPEVWRAG